METNNLILNSNGTILTGVSKNAVTVTIPESVKVIPNGVFHNCKFLKEVSMSNSVTDIEAYAFMGCSNLTKINLSDNIKVIECCTFRGCSSLKSIELPSATIKINDLAFYGCNSLTEITFDESLTKIGKAAFYGCTSLEMVRLNTTLREIGFRAFNVCPSLMTIHCGSHKIKGIMIDPKAFDTYAYRICKIVTRDLKQCENHMVLGKFNHIGYDSRSEEEKAATAEERDSGQKGVLRVKIKETSNAHLNDHLTHVEEIL